MMTRPKRSRIPALPAPLRTGKIRQLDRNGRTFFAAVDVVAALTSAADAPALWAELKRLEPAVAALGVAVTFPEPHQQSLPAVGDAVAVDAVDLEGMLRLVQSTEPRQATRIVGQDAHSVAACRRPRKAGQRPRIVALAEQIDTGRMDVIGTPAMGLDTERQRLIQIGGQLRPQHAGQPDDAFVVGIFSIDTCLHCPFPACVAPPPRPCVIVAAGPARPCRPQTPCAIGRLRCPKARSCIRR